MSSIRKSPTQSATLYKVGTKKTGNDGNTWIIVENVNKIKRWQLYKKTSKINSKKTSSKTISKKTSKINSKKTSSKTISKKTISLIKLYDIPKIKPNNWTIWLENLNLLQQKSVNKIRNSYKSIEKETGIIVIEIILPKSNSGLYWSDYSWDYAKLLYPDMITDNLAYLMIVYKINEDLHLPNLNICAQHKGIVRTYKKKFIEYIEKFNKEPYSKCKWNGSTTKEICFNL